MSLLYICYCLPFLLLLLLLLLIACVLGFHPSAINRDSTTGVPNPPLVVALATALIQPQLTVLLERGDGASLPDFWLC